jgi:hypothetical protein
MQGDGISFAGVGLPPSLLSTVDFLFSLSLQFRAFAGIKRLPWMGFSAYGMPLKAAMVVVFSSQLPS